MLLWVGLKHLLIGIALLVVVLSVFFRFTSRNRVRQ